MATKAPPTAPTPRFETDLDEANITSCLARLQEVHVALRNLRNTIPRIMDSVLVDPTAPEQMHLQFAQAARAAASDVKSFSQIMEDPWSKIVLEKARESRMVNAEDITNWLVTEHEDWLDVKEETENQVVDEEKQDAGAANAAGPNTEDMQAMVEKFKESHPAIDALVDESARIVKIHLPPPAHIHFHIQPREPDETGLSGYSVDTKEKTKLHKAILEAVNASAQVNKLGSVLEMLASYADIKTRACVKCTRLLDRNAQFSVRRTRKRTKEADGRYVTTWEAFHAACS